MAFQFTCPNPECHHAGKAPDVYQGRFVRCKRCGHKFRLGSPAGSESCGAAPANPGKSEPLLSETGEYVPSMIETSVMDLEIPAPFPRQVGRFQLRARLGVGAFATVFRALDPQLDREVALKIPHPGLLDSARSRERFLREARVAGQLRHANIVTVYEAGSEQDTHYIATALIPGRTLGQIIEDDRPDFAQAARMVRDVAQALAYAHDLGVVHRDVKPSNIMVDDKGEVFLMDFGLAYRLDAAERVTFQGAILGTPAYMAPEQAGGNSGEAQPASDQYSLGAVLYKLLCGQPPFVGSSEAVLYNAIHQPPTAPRTLNAKVPHELEAICLRALAKRPEDRYPSCRDMAEDLDRWLENFPTRAGSPSLEAKVQPGFRRSRRNKVLVLGAVGIALLVSLLALMLKKDPAPVSPLPAPPIPSLRINPDRVSLAAGQTQGIEIEVQRAGRLGPIRLRLKDLPDSVTPGPIQPAPAPDHFRIDLTARPEAPDATTEVVVMASSDDWHVEKVFTLGVTKAPRFHIPEELPPVTLIPGRSQLVEVVVDRRGFQGAIQLQIDLEDLPDQVVAQPATIPADKDRAQVTLLAPEAAPHGKKRVRLRATGAGQIATTAFQVTISDPPSLTMTLTPETVSLQPGKLQAVIIQVRRSGWEGPVQLRVADLPPGVKVRQPLPALVAGQQTARVEFAAGPDAREVTRKVQVVARAGNLEATGHLFMTIRTPAQAPPPSRSIHLLSNLKVTDVVLALAVDAAKARALFGGGGKYVNGEIVGGRDFSVKFMDLNSLRWLRAAFPSLPRNRGRAASSVGDRIHCLALFPGKDLAITGHADGSLCFWNAKTQKEVTHSRGNRFWKEHKDAVMAVAISPDGNSLVSADRSGKIIWWAVEDGKPQATRSIPWSRSGPVFVAAITFAHDNQTCLLGDSRGKIWKGSLRKVKDRNYHLDLSPVGGAAEHQNAITCLALSPDGNLLLSGSSDFSVGVWDWKMGTMLRRFAGHGNQVYSVCFTPDGRWALSGGYDKKVCLWEVATGKEVCPAYEGYTQPIRRLAVFQTPDGLKALCAGLGDNVQVLQIPK